MPVPENTEEGPLVESGMPSTNQEGETVSKTSAAADQSGDAVIVTQNEKPAKKKKARLRRRQKVASCADRATDRTTDTATDGTTDRTTVTATDGTTDRTTVTATDGTTDRDFETEADGVVEDGKTCAEKFMSSDVDAEKAATTKEKVDTSGASEQVIEKKTTNLTPLPKPLPTLAYDEVSRLSRTMHYADFRKCFKAKKFITSKVKSQYKTLLPRNGDFVWFRAQNNGMNDDDQDWFGNVRCSFDLLNFLKENKSVNLFYVDCAYFGYSSASRILLTKKKKFGKAKKIDFGSLRYGDPLMFDGEKLFFLRKDVSSNKKWYGNHQTEVVIDASTIDTRSLFALCEKTAVNHSNANRIAKNKRFVYHQCLIYNSTNKNCPSAWSAEETAKCLKDFMGIENSLIVSTI
ncbi:hypothetical protein FHG87_016674 [Trinorchestia longiramus]|nr:hypothetical protein FHG87_016674 [Trinorchestia longiramus]